MTAGATAWAAPGGGSGGYSGGGGGGGGGYSGGGGGGYSGGGGGGYSGGGGSGGSGSIDDMPGWAWVLVVLFIVAVILNAAYQQSRRKVAFEAGGSDWDGSGRAVTRRPIGPRLSQRRKREEMVKMAAEEAAMDDAAFTPESVKTATVTLHKAIVEAWTARDRAALAELVGPDLMVEWNRRLDDFDRKGWHNITERLADPTVEYLGLVNREGEQQDRVTVRIEAPIRDYTVDSKGERLLRTDDTDDTTTLPEYWTLGRHNDGGWILVSIEQDAEGGHVLAQDIVARPDADTARLHDEAVAEVATVGNVPDEQVKDIAPLSFDGDARTAALDLANIDGRFDPDVLEASARRAVAAWAEAVDGDDVSLSLVASQGAIDELLYGYDKSKRTRLVVRGPVLKSIRIGAIDAQATPATMTIHAELTGRRYRENRDTTTVVEGSKDKETTFTESWTMALDGNDETPWRLVGSASATYA
ncbi:MAG TPA: TIM44-like domain-containing protein [Acidimicrobiia bacterium]|nr:TIM44-like domain-containing protein [Acidimicrobiia bacterium]